MKTPLILTLLALSVLLILLVLALKPGDTGPRESGTADGQTGHTAPETAAAIDPETPDPPPGRVEREAAALDIPQGNAEQTLHGAVLNALDDAPIAGALVVVEIPQRSWLPVKEVARQRTDDRGRFIIENLPGESSDWMLRVSKPGFVPAQWPRPYGRPAPRERIVRLRPGTAITGEVVFAGGRPVTGGHGFTLPDPSAQPRSRPGQGFAEARYFTFRETGPRFELDENGRFQTAVRSARVAFEVYGPSFAPAFSVVIEPRRGVRSHVVIHVEPAQVLRGRVRTPDGEPVAGASVVCMPAIPDRHPDHLFYGYSEKLHSVSRKDGSFEIHGMSPQYRSLLALHDDHADHSEYNLLADTAVPVEITLQRSQWIEGTLVDRAGRPVSGHPLRLEAAKKTAVSLDSDGRFRSQGLGLDISSGTLFVDGFPPVELTWEPGAGMRDLGEVELRTAGTVSLEIRDQEGSALSGCAVEVDVVRKAGESPVRFDRVVSDESGQAVSNCVEGPLVRLRVFKDGFGPWEKSLETGEEDIEVAVTMIRDAMLVGTVVDPSGRPVRDVGVRVYAAGPKRWSASAASFSDGRFELRDVAPGSDLQLNLDASGYRNLGKELPPVEPGEVLDLGTLSLEPGHALTGEVVDGAGRPVADAVVAVSLVTASFNTGMSIDPWTETDDNGSFRIPGLEPGRYMAVAALGGDTSNTEAVDLREAAGATIRLVLDRKQGQDYRGVVLNQEGEAVSQASVYIGAEGRNGLYASTLANGEFSFQDVPLDVPLRVRVDHERYRDLELDVGSLGELPAEFVLEHGPRLDIHVAVAGSRPTPRNVTVHLRGPRLRWSRPMRIESGVIHLSGLPEGTVEVQLVASDFPLPTGVEVELVDGVLREIEVELDGASEPIAIHVVDSEGNPVQGASLRFNRGPSRSTSFFGNERTDERGIAYSYYPLSRDVEMTVGARGFQDVVVPDAKTRIDGGRITVRLVRQDG